MHVRIVTTFSDANNCHWTMMHLPVTLLGYNFIREGHICCMYYTPEFHLLQQLLPGGNSSDYSSNSEFVPYYRYTDSKQEFKSSETDATQHKITGLQPYTLYEFRVLAKNLVGVGKASLPIDVQTGEDG